MTNNSNSDMPLKLPKVHVARARVWFFGDYHDNKNIFDKEIQIYEQLIRTS